MKKIILNAKDQVAKRFGYKDGIMGTSWEYAMRLTHRTKKQIILHETVIDLMAGAIQELNKKLDKN